ncbi:type II toxin-antitoxin system VapC family toxin [Cyanobium sp. ATX 6F1]|uniref:type II toxin-antitoxin system VapC family toxin n=1 Tax=unclassified Cyanobium TaxID=2627006 RepID=UPI0020CE26DC|nr:type II toxin-antitoxin system VapC family toxin [Cyanobium sp. ATX 6F1]
MAVLLGESDAGVYLNCLNQEQSKFISTATLVEAQIVTMRYLGEAGLAELQLLLQLGQVNTVALAPAHVAWALKGWCQFGKGNHPAALNLGDCFSYALAKALDRPLLFKGSDFAQTDLRPALDLHREP